MTILNIETGTDICSVALSQNGKLIALRESGAGEGRDHSAMLALYIDQVLKGSETLPKNLDAVAVSMGPGSYTGLRIGVSTAKGICYGLGIPLIAVGSLESMVNVAVEEYRAGLLRVERWESALLCPMIDARRMEVYTQIFTTDLQPLTEVAAEIITADSFANYITPKNEFIVFGDGAQKSLDILPKTGVKYIEVLPSARGMVSLAERAFRESKFEDIAYFEPLYLKDFVVIPSKKKLL